MKVLVYDNYDSFTYNLVHLVEKIIGQRVDVVKNDDKDWEKLKGYDFVILSPGPGLPSSAGSMMQLIGTLAGTTSILGVCLGHQAIAEAFGGRLLNLPEVFHGRSTVVHITDREDILFSGLPEIITVGRYHSWVVDPDSLPPSLLVTAVDSDGHIMALRHSQLDICSVQFHPESIMTPEGEKIIRNWLIRN